MLIYSILISCMQMSKTNSSGFGNTNQTPSHVKRIPASKIWFFTLNNYLKKDISLLSSLYPKECSYLCFQEEQGEQGTQHLQGVIKFKTGQRPLECRFFKDLSNKPHWEKCRNFEKAKEYCKKEETRVGNVYEFPKPFQIRITLRNWQREIIDIISEEPDDRTIYWYWSQEGGIGKTTFCKYLTMNYGAICLHGKGSDIRNGVLDYYNKNKEYPILCLFPIPRSYNEEYLSYEGLENIKDMYFYSGKYEGGMVCGPCPHLIVFANVPPNLNMCSRDRWIVRELT